MPTYTLEIDNRAALAASLNGDGWIVACLCAAWCDVCCEYRASFEELAARHPDKHFVWVDIEDQAEVVGEMDVDNFPTLLIQRGDTIAFYGTVQPDWRQANRLLQSQVEKSMAELQAEAQSSAQRRDWQQECNLLDRIKAAI